MPLDMACVLSAINTPSIASHGLVMEPDLGTLVRKGIYVASLRSPLDYTSTLLSLYGVDPFAAFDALRGSVDGGDQSAGIFAFITEKGLDSLLKPAETVFKQAGEYVASLVSPILPRGDIISSPSLWLRASTGTDPVANMTAEAGEDPDFCTNLAEKRVSWRLCFR